MTITHWRDLPHACRVPGTEWESPECKACSHAKPHTYEKALCSTCFNMMNACEPTNFELLEVCDAT